MNENADLVSRCAVELRRMIGAKEISPVELLDACIERIEAINPAVNAVTATCYAQAREAAKAAERQVLNGEPLGLLHGLPLGVKDLEDTAGLLTTYGSPMSRGNVPSRDVVLVERLRAAGAILVAKTNVPELGAGANTRNPVWGATGNPFNPQLNAGGSSGRIGGRARMRHAADMHRFGYRRLTAYSCIEMRRGGLPSDARTRAELAQAGRLDADLGGRANGPYRR